MASLKPKIDMAMAFSIKTLANMKVNGEMIKQMAWALLFIMKVIIIMVSGLMINYTDTEYINQLITHTNMKENGTKTRNKDKEKKQEKMIMFILETG